MAIKMRAAVLKRIAYEQLSDRMENDLSSVDPVDVDDLDAADGALALIRAIDTGAKQIVIQLARPKAV